MELATASEMEERIFTVKILGRLLELLGVQMYKRRDVALAELVANCWDAGAERARIELPDPDAYDRDTSEITILDDGSGMTPEEVDDHYLVVGRNRRKEGEPEDHSRPVMGRKGLGKLAGLGIGEAMTVETWKDGQLTRVSLKADKLKTESDEEKEVKLAGQVGPAQDMPFNTGTRLRIGGLKHKTPISAKMVHRALARRFSRTVTGKMEIFVNGEPLREPSIDWEWRKPKKSGWEQAELSDGSTVRYFYGFSKKVLTPDELRGLTIYVRGKTAEAPPFFFNVEATASGQYGTRYMHGAIEADYLDEGIDDESDLISTDRQKLDWEDDRLESLRDWGDALTRKALREHAQRKEEEMRDWLLEIDEFRRRIEALDEESEKQIKGFLKKLGRVDTGREEVRPLADSLIKAYEYRNFHNVIDEIQAVGEDPEQLHRLLHQLHVWRVLESRTILEIIEGRLKIIDKFHEMIVNNAPETAPRVGTDNLHDLIARHPWLLNPEWQVLAEEKSITRQLREWGEKDIPAAELQRYDFLALNDEGRLVVIEIKRGNHGADIDDLNRLIKYKDRLSRGSDKRLLMLMICGAPPQVSQDELESWDRRRDGEIKNWSEIHDRTERHYRHYQAVLRGEVSHPDFDRKKREVAATRTVLASGSAYRTPEERAGGLGPQDAEGQTDVDSHG